MKYSLTWSIHDWNKILAREFEARDGAIVELFGRRAMMEAEAIIKQYEVKRLKE